MLSVLIKYLIAKLETFEYLDKVHGLSTIVQVGDETMPAVYSGNELVHVNFDSYDSLVYIQQNGKVGRETTEHPAIACKYNVAERYPLRLIVYSQGKENVNCESHSQQIADSIKAALNGKQQTLETAANLTNATIILGDTDLDKNSVWQTQFSSPNQLKDSDILIAIDLEFEIEGDDTCFANNPCENSEFVFDLSTQTFCERVDDCLDIPSTNGNYVLKILNGVKSWMAAASSATWGSITGTLSDQTDLNTALSNKANASDLTAHTSNTSNPHSVTATQVDALKRDGSNANSDIDLGAYKLNAQSLGVKGVNGAGHVGLKHQASNATASANETSLFAGSDGELYYKNDGNSVVQIATRAWVTAQGYITNVITALGYTPENVANKTTTIAGNESSTTLYANVKGLVDWVKQGMTALLSSLGLTKTTPVDADSLLLNDSADSNKLKLLSWANLKATLKTYFDTLYNGQINPITQFSAFTHFTEISPGIGAGTTGAGVWELGNGWVLARSSAGASATVLPAEAGRPGLVRHSTGASNNQIRCGEVWVSSAPLVFKGHFRIQTLSGGGQTFAIFCGFQEGGTLSVTPTDAIRIVLTDANVLQVEVIKSSVALVVNTGVTVAVDTHYDIVITKADTTNECQFYVNGVNVYSLTNAADIATYVPQNLSMVCNNSFRKTGGASARTFDTDFAYVTNNLPI